MPGIVAYLGVHPAAPVVLNESAAAALKARPARPPAAHGWRTDRGEHHSPGPFDRRAFEESTSEITWLLAASGPPPADGPPPPAALDGHALACLGTAYNRRDLSVNASSTAAALLEVYATMRNLGLPPDVALADTMSAALMPAHAVAVRDAEGVLVTHHRHLIMWAHTDHAGGAYVASAPFASAAPLPEQRPNAFHARLPPPVQGGRHHRPSVSPAVTWPPADAVRVAQAT